MITCKEASEISVKKSIEKLTFSEWIQHRLHLMVCKYCKLFQMQQTWIDSLIIKHLETKGLSEKEKIDLKSSLKIK